MAQKNKTTQTTSQQPLFDFATDAPTPTRVQYGDRTVTATHTGPLVASSPTTTPNAATFSTPTATPAPDASIIPDERAPERRIAALGGTNASQLEARDLADFEDAVQRLYEHMKSGDVYMDVPQIREFTGQSNGDRRARDLRKCQLTDGRWVWLVSERIKGRRGGVYHIEHHAHRQPDGNNGRNAGGDTL